MREREKIFGHLPGLRGKTRQLRSKLKTIFEQLRGNVRIISEQDAEM